MCEGMYVLCMYKFFLQWPALKVYSNMCCSFKPKLRVCTHVYVHMICLFVCLTVVVYKLKGFIITFHVDMTILTHCCFLEQPIVSRIWGLDDIVSIKKATHPAVASTGIWCVFVCACQTTVHVLLMSEVQVELEKLTSSLLGVVQPHLQGTNLPSLSIIRILVAEWHPVFH